MKYLKRYESNDFDIKSEYLNDLLSDANLNGVSFEFQSSIEVNPYVNITTVSIKSEIYKIKGSSKYGCFSLSNYLEEILHFISYMYSEGYKLMDSSYKKVHYFRSEPYEYLLDIWSSKNINEVLEHCRKLLDDTKYYANAKICGINLNFKPM